MLLSGLLVLLLAGLFQGSFGLGMKKYQPFSWEAFWALFSIVGMIIAPCIWTYIEVPQFFHYLKQTPSSIFIPAAICGFFWGVTAIGFGKAIDYIGMSLTYGIAMGVSAAVGSLFPLITGKTLPASNFMIGLFIGIVVMLSGVAILTKAGILKDKESSREDKGKNPKFQLGLILAFVAGLGSAAQNIGFNYAGYTSQMAIKDGVGGTQASLLGWLLVFTGGFIANFGYALYLLIKNRNFGNYVEKGCGTGYFKVIITGLMWFAALGVYGKATFLLGEYGTVVGWIGFQALALVISNFWGIKDGEWTGHEKPKKVMLVGNIVLIISWIIIGITNGML
ncbi:L-rhamnose/proton symporter RhaT [Clostridium sp. Marseille-Q2269]|uniref:L-rhamnose/proton symporter RhaT n=1 Tax=Clostridium sp. Marseille-Q2269 TaxID=2942205 RepID=UPI00207489D5|nr:L-rhamnose/proton symporter RhaT [Clostridium sp. Marseille-Q2269]